MNKPMFVAFTLEASIIITKGLALETLKFNIAEFSLKTKSAQVMSALIELE